METIVNVFKFIYVYCTDFLINISNISGLSYYETNALIFCFIYPFLCILLPLIYLILILNQIKNKKHE